MGFFENGTDHIKVHLCIIQILVQATIKAPLDSFVCSNGVFLKAKKI